MRKKNYIHRDLKPDNIFIIDPGKNDKFFDEIEPLMSELNYLKNNNCIIKIGDLGFVKSLNEKDIY